MQAPVTTAQKTHQTAATDLLKPGAARRRQKYLDLDVDTIHGVLKYTRDKENKVTWAQQSAFGQYEFIFGW